MAGIKCVAEQEKRFCIVGNECGYFHTWEHFLQPLPEAGLLINGVPAGVFSRVYGIVEFADGVRRVEITDIRFCDDENGALVDINKHINMEDDLK